LEDQYAQFYALTATDNMGIHQGRAEGLEIAITRVRALQGIADPGELQEKLQALAAELTAEASQLEAPLRKLSNTGLETLLNPAPNMEDMLKQLGPMMEGARTGGKVQGLHTGANMIRWYLEQWSLWRFPPSSS
jgi:hypothetical protein